jgi:hypothetical protein
MIRDVHPGSYPSGIPDPGVKKEKDPRSGSATLITSRSFAKIVVLTRSAKKKFCLTTLRICEKIFEIWF